MEILLSSPFVVYVFIETFLLSCMAAARLSPTWPLALQIFSLHDLILVVVLSCLPFLPKMKVTLFLPELLPKLTVQPGWSPFISSFFGTQAHPAPAPLGCPYWGISSLPDFLGLQDCLPRDFVNQAPKQASVGPMEVQVTVLLTLSLLCGNQKFYHFVIPMPKMTSNHHITYKSFAVHKQQVRYHSEVSSLVGWLGKRNLGI